ncbi:bifunctional tetrahydrofolate synthase/dihydrofolate synthase [Marinobacter halophilus]|uniref:Dihydrofolate synthase/folylpolyglutamate synthase n=1 Tax=Marinobacter halophilus TaxID=1323740 RepID=A0A2T1K8D7_9GAMM|nr:bifunctional tetrahydrofolate synthase/dihydrofolate synthase [Marinobacter halophilus]PSF06396.1 bifunctional tetrahydrofolate synthase/dihydrofolate synthase [Marinobacter halophilus]GGC72215.1 bifunctional folylpolyglutamate synthase/dihydrofolate synthase [Marinobacter halophilus]
MKPPSTENKPASPEAGASVDQWLQWLEAIHPTEIDLGLDRVLVVLRRLFPRKPAARIITIAGTNGKGTAVATVDRLLRTAGRSTGAYTSPHLQRYNERVRVNGQEITDAALVSAFEQVEAARGKVSLTYFEFGTLAAFVAFAHAGVEDWILEVGLGGRLDAVNVLDADFAVITSIDIDHVGFLGDNREVIGFEKAGILRRGIFAVCADPEPPSSVLQQAAAQKVDLKVTGRDYQIVPGMAGSSTVDLILESEQISLPAGPLPIESVAAGVVLARVLEPQLSADRVSDAVRLLTVPGRFEQLRSDPDVILDVGHNPHAARWLAAKLTARTSSSGRIFGVYAALADKDIVGVLSAMVPVVDQWWFAGLDVHRGLDSGALVEHARACGIDRYLTFASVNEALLAAMAEANSTDTIAVFGSFYTVAQARELLQGEVS